MNFIDSVVINSDNGTDEAKIESYKIVKHVEVEKKYDEDDNEYYDVKNHDFSYADYAVLKQLFDTDKLIDTLVVILTEVEYGPVVKKEIIHPYSFNNVDVQTPDFHHSEFNIMMGLNSEETCNVFVNFYVDNEEMEVIADRVFDMEHLRNDIKKRVIEVKYDASQDRLIDAHNYVPVLFDELYESLEQGYAVVATASMGEDAPTIRTSNFYFGLTDSNERFIAATTVVFADAVTMFNTCISFIATTDGYAKLADVQMNAVTGSPVE